MSGSYVLVGRSFSVVEIAGATEVTGRAPELAFGDDMRISGRASVNRINGSYDLDDDVLTVGPLVSTMMAGPPEAMDQERRLLGVLGRPLRVTVDETGDVLLDDGAAVTRLVPVGADAAGPQADAALAGDVPVGLPRPAGVVRGSVTYLARIALPPEAVLRVAVTDADGQVLGESVEPTAGRQVPLRYTVMTVQPYDAAVVTATIEVDGRIAWATAEPHAASTSPVDIVVVPI